MQLKASDGTRFEAADWLVLADMQLGFEGDAVVTPDNLGDMNRVLAMYDSVKGNAMRQIYVCGQAYDKEVYIFTLDGKPVDDDEVLDLQ